MASILLALLLLHLTSWNHAPCCPSCTRAISTVAPQQMRQNLLHNELDAPEFILEWASSRQNQGIQSGGWRPCIQVWTTSVGNISLKVLLTNVFSLSFVFATNGPICSLFEFFRIKDKKCIAETQAMTDEDRYQAKIEQNKIYRFTSFRLHKGN